MVRWMIVGGFIQDCFNEGDWNSVVWLSGWVFFAVTFELALQGFVVVLSGGIGVGGRRVYASQLEGRGKGRKRILDGPNSDLMASACSSQSNLFSEGTEPVELIAAWHRSLNCALEKRVQVTLLAPLFPMTPISMLELGSRISDAIGCGFCSSIE